MLETTLTFTCHEEVASHLLASMDLADGRLVPSSDRIGEKQRKAFASEIRQRSDETTDYSQRRIKIEQFKGARAAFTSRGHTSSAYQERNAGCRLEDDARSG